MVNNRCGPLFYYRFIFIFSNVFIFFSSSFALRCLISFSTPLLPSSFPSSYFLSLSLSLFSLCFFTLVCLPGSPSDCHSFPYIHFLSICHDPFLFTHSFIHSHPANEQNSHFLTLVFFLLLNLHSFQPKLTPTFIPLPPPFALQQCSCDQCLVNNSKQQTVTDNNSNNSNKQEQDFCNNNSNVNITTLVSRVSILFFSSTATSTLTTTLTLLTPYLSNSNRQLCFPLFPVAYSHFLPTTHCDQPTKRLNQLTFSTL